MNAIDEGLNVRSGFLFLRSFRDGVRELNRPDLEGILFKAIVDYGLDETEPDFGESADAPILRALWVGLKPTIGTNGAPTKKKKHNGASCMGFINWYLTPSKVPDIRAAERFCQKYIIKKKPIPVGVSEYIKQMPYKDFLLTTYWRGVSLAVRRLSGNVCSSCGSTDRLDVHHLTYKHHGDEVHHLADLSCVCRSCHNSIHDLVKSSKIPADNGVNE